MVRSAQQKAKQKISYTKMRLRTRNLKGETEVAFNLFNGWGARQRDRERKKLQEDKMKYA